MATAYIRGVRAQLGGAWRRGAAGVRHVPRACARAPARARPSLRRRTTAPPSCTTPGRARRARWAWCSPAPSSRARTRTLGSPGRPRSARDARTRPRRRGTPRPGARSRPSCWHGCRAALPSPPAGTKLRDSRPVGFPAPSLPPGTVLRTRPLALREGAVQQLMQPSPLPSR